MIRQLEQIYFAMRTLFATRVSMDRLNRESIARAKSGHGELTVILHGIFATYYGAMWQFVEFLKKRNINVVAIGYDYRADLKTQAEQVSTQIEEMLRETGAPTINLVGISLGGVVARYYIEGLGKRSRVRKLVTVFTPVLTPTTSRTTSKNLAYYMEKIISSDYDKSMAAAKEIEGHFSIKTHLALYGLHDHIVGKQYPVLAEIKQVAVPGGHVFVSFNPNVMRLVADYLVS